MPIVGPSFSSDQLTSMLQERLNGAGSVAKPQVALPKPTLGTSSSSSSDFLSTLKAAAGEVNQSLKEADVATRDFVTGKADNLHQVMIAMEKADISLRTLSSVRGKLLESYQEVMRMQV